MTALRAGQRLYSTTSTAELIVVRPADVALLCAGAPLADASPGQDRAGSSTDGSGTPLQVGKRYEDPESGLLLMCTKAGDGPLEVDGRELSPQASKPLPSSD